MTINRGIFGIAAALLLVSPLTADVVEQGPKDAKPSGLMAGTAKADISPPVGIPHQNWGSATHIEAVGIDPVGMYARVLVLSDGQQKFALVDVDGSAGSAEEVIREASAKTGIPAEHIRIGNSHTHAGAALSRSKGPAGADLTRYNEMFSAHRAVVTAKVIGAIVEANSKLRPVHANGMVGQGSINVNRRFRATAELEAAVGLNPNEYVDRDLVVIRIDDADGKPYAVLVNFQCHGTVLAYENKYVSPDWIGSMRETVESNLTGATAFFFQGAAGNQGPIEGFSGDLNVARRLGSILGHEASALALRIDTVKRAPKFEGFVQSTALQAKQPWRVDGPRDGTLKFARKVIEVPRHRHSAEEIGRMEKLAASATAEVAKAKQSGDSWAEYQAGAKLRRYEGLLSRWRQPVSAQPLRHEIGVLRIGEVAMVLTTGELFAEIGAAVKKASPFPVTVFAGYGSGVGGGYMPTRAEYALGGYEVDGTPFGVGSAEKFIEEATALLKSVR